MMRPPCGVWRRIRPKAARAHRNMPVMLTLAERAASPRPGSRRSGRPGSDMPALLNSTSSRPQSASTRAKAASTCGRVGHVAGQDQRRRRRRRFRAAPPRAARSAPTRQPAARKARAVARPMPLPAPVMTMLPVVSMRALPLAFRGEGATGGRSAQAGSCTLTARPCDLPCPCWKAPTRGNRSSGGSHAPRSRLCRCCHRPARPCTDDGPFHP